MTPASRGTLATKCQIHVIIIFYFGQFSNQREGTKQFFDYSFCSSEGHEVQRCRQPADRRSKTPFCFGSMLFVPVRLQVVPEVKSNHPSETPRGFRFDMREYRNLENGCPLGKRLRHCSQHRQMHRGATHWVRSSNTVPHDAL